MSTINPKFTDRDDFELTMYHKRSVAKISLFVGIPLLFAMAIKNFIKADNIMALLSCTMLLMLILLGFVIVRKIDEKSGYKIYSILFRLFFGVMGVSLIYDIGFQSNFSRIEWCYIYPVLVFLAVGVKEGLICVSFFYAILAFLILNFDLQGVTLFQIQELRSRFLVSFFAVCILSLFLEQGFRRAQQRLLHHQHNLKESENRYRQAYEQLNIEVQERKRADEALLNAAQQWRTTFDGISDIVCLLDSEGKILRCNKAMTNLLGKPFSEIIGRPHWEIIHGTTAPIKESPFERIRETRRKEIAILPIGDRRFNIAVDPLFDEAGSLLGAVHIMSDITEQKQAEEALRRSEERYRTTLENIEEGYYEVDLAGNFTFVNDTVSKHLGYSVEELIGMNYRQYWDEKTAREFYQAYNTVYSTGKPSKQLDAQFIRKDGTKRFFEVLASLIKDSEGKPIGFRGVSWDVTDRKEAEEEVRRNQEKLQALMDASPMAISWAGMNGNIEYTNRKFRELFGYTVEDIPTIAEWRRRAYPDPAYRETIPSLLAVLTEAQKQGREATPIEVAITCKDGSRRYVEQTGAFASNRTLAIYNDLTDRKRAEEALRQSEERYRTILENMQEVYYEIDLSGNYIFVNEAFYRHLGYTKEEMIGKKSRQYQDETTANKLFQAYTRLYRTGEPIKAVEGEWIRKDGAKRTYEMSASLIRDSEGKPIGFRGVSRDITERKRAEEALKKSEEEAKSLSQENAIMAEIGRIISSTLNIEEVYERFGEEVRKLIPLDRIALSTFNFKNHSSTMAYTFGVEVEDRKHEAVFPLTGSLYEELIAKRSGILIQTEDESELAERYPSLLSTFRAGLRSMLSVPLISKDEVIGVLHIRSLKPNAYTELDLRLAERVGNQIAGAIANAQLYAERKRAEEALKKSEEEAKSLSQENAILAEIGRIISSTLNIEEVYESFAEEVRKLIPFDRIVINNIDIEKGTVVNAYMAGKGLGDRKVGEIYPLEGSGNAEMVRTKSTLLIQSEDFNEYKDRFPMLLSTFEAGFRSIMNVPLFSKGQIIGGLLLRSFKPYAYTNKDVKLAERVGNQIAGAIANIQLFMERERAAEALRQSEEKYRTILENIEDGYFEDDLAGNLTFFNDPVCGNLGYSREELTGMNYRQYTDETTARKLYQIYDRVYRTGEPIKELEAEYIRKDGTKGVYEQSVSLIRNSEGKPIGFRGVTRDVTERKRAEEERLALQEQLRQSQKMEAIGKLAGGVAHDFNNLLTVIKGYSELILDSLDQNNRLRQDVQEIMNASERASSLTRQLLAFSRKQVLQPKVLDLNAHVSDMDKMLRRMIGEDIELVTLLAKDLGRIKADPGQIEQVILNLAINAKDAMLKGGKLTIETANVKLDEGYARSHIGVTSGHYVMLSMSDTGAGITPEIKERIFEPFFTTKEKGKGTGLGLSTVYGIIQQSGGNVWVYSEPGLGTTFKIYLPMIEEGRSFIQSLAVSTKPLQGSETILLVEDEEMVRKLACTVLQKYGYTVLEAPNGEEALRIVQGQNGDPIHLMVTDVVMPGMSGRQLADRLASLWPGMKVLYMSGYTDNAIVHHGVLEPGIAYIQKPFAPDSLASKVREMLDGY